MGREGKRPRPAKDPDALARVREGMKTGRFRDTRHAKERKLERDITILEIRQVVESGYHEKRKDEFKAEWQSWNYAIRGRTIDRRELRVAVSFDEGLVPLIITAIDLGRP